MTYELGDSPLRYVVASFGIVKHPDVHGFVTKAFDQLQGLGLTNFGNTNLQSFTISAGQLPQAHLIKQSYLFNKDESIILIVQDNALVIAINNYIGFENFSKYLESLFLIFDEHNFPSVTSSTFRYVNEFITKELPTDLVNQQFQGDAELWGKSKHIHLDNKIWIDMDDSDEELWLAIKGSKGHKSTSDNSNNLPLFFTSKNPLNKGIFGVAIDLWHISKGLKESYDQSLLNQLDSQREKLKEIFKSVLTDESRSLWKYREISHATEDKTNGN